MARLLAACGIVWFHAGATGAIYGYAGLAFFIVVLVQLAAPAIHRMNFTTFARTRAARLLGPWLWASALYTALKLAQVALTPATLRHEFDATMLLTGPALHLWFLPFAFVVSLSLWPLLRRLPRPTPVTLVGVAAVACALAMIHPALPVPLAQWVYGLPGVLAGLCVVWSRPAGVRLGALTLGFAGMGLLTGWPAGLLPLTLALVVLTGVTVMPRPATALTDLAARSALWVYLLHPAVASLLHQASGLPRDAVITAVLTIAVTLLVSVLAIIARDHLQHTRQRPVAS